MDGTGLRTKAPGRMVALGLVFGALAAWPSPQPSSEAWVRYEDPQKLFSIQFPADWKPKVTFGSRDRASFAGVTGGCRVRLDSHPEEATLSSAEAVAELTPEFLGAQIELEFSHAKLLSAKAGTLAGLPARIVEFEHSPAVPLDGPRWHQLSAWAFRAGVAYLVSCSSAVADYPAIEPEFRSVLESFSLPELTLPEALRVPPEVLPLDPGPRPHFASPNDGPGAAGAAIFLFLYPLLALLHAWIARRKRRNPWPWALLGPLFFPIALVILARKRAPTELS